MEVHGGSWGHFRTCSNLILGVATVLFSVNNIRRADFERARQLHADLTGGPVADARHVFGSVMEDPARTSNPELKNEEIKSLFVVLWCFERIDVARRSILGQWRHLPRWLNPRLALDESIRYHVRIYTEYIHRARINGMSVWEVLFVTDDAGLPHLAKSLQINHAEMGTGE
ncbi:hypothetical protein [Actinoplanes sp. HUAS TT8]|uniref:hypothetical protein n=1 Tax=Actinoplanes sp. HUAS TT8 TaxID=3447453 RepID=UPI003F523ECE